MLSLGRRLSFLLCCIPVLFVGIKFLVHQKGIKDVDQKVIVYRHNVWALDKNVKKKNVLRPHPRTNYAFKNNSKLGLP